MSAPPTPTPPPPLLRLAPELHLSILSFLPALSSAEEKQDLALLQLRRTTRYFRHLVPPPTRDDVLALESSALRGSAVYACRFCACLRPASKFAAAMLKGKTGPNGAARHMRFCADCGFDTAVAGRGQRYSRGSRARVQGVELVWCKRCKAVKKGDEAVAGCVGLCRPCYRILGCTCRVRCGGRLESAAPVHQGVIAPVRRSVVSAARSRRVRRNASDTESSGEEQSGGYDYWEEQLWLAQNEDDDWRLL